MIIYVATASTMSIGPLYTMGKEMQDCRFERFSRKKRNIYRIMLGGEVGIFA